MSAAAFDPMGKINAAATERGLRLNQDFGDSLEQIGERHESLDAEQMRGITGSDYYLGGVSTPGAVLIQTPGYLRSFAPGLAYTVSLFENSPVLSLLRTGCGG